jgi:hypothetical protein
MAGKEIYETIQRVTNKAAEGLGQTPETSAKFEKAGALYRDGQIVGGFKTSIAANVQSSVDIVAALGGKIDDVVRGAGKLVYGEKAEAHFHDATGALLHGELKESVRSTVDGFKAAFEEGGATLKSVFGGTEVKGSSGPTHIPVATNNKVRTPSS